MSSGADLFVVCKQCGSEVSPYITECPYCGHRLRRRAPEAAARAGRRRAPRARRRRLGALLRRSGAAARAPARAAPARARARWATARPYATIALVALSCGAVGRVARRTRSVRCKLAIAGPLHGDWWRLFSTSSPTCSGVYAFVDAARGRDLRLAARAPPRPGRGARAVPRRGRDRGAGGERRVRATRSSAAATRARWRCSAAWAVPDLQAARAGRLLRGRSARRRRRSPRCCWRCRSRARRRAGWRA